MLRSRLRLQQTFHRSLIAKNITRESGEMLNHRDVTRGPNTRHEITSQCFFYRRSLSRILATQPIQLVARRARIDCVPGLQHLVERQVPRVTLARRREILQFWRNLLRVSGEADGIRETPILRRIRRETKIGASDRRRSLYNNETIVRVRIRA